MPVENLENKEKCLAPESSFQQRFRTLNSRATGCPTVPNLFNGKSRELRRMDPRVFHFEIRKRGLVHFIGTHCTPVRGAETQLKEEQKAVR